MRMTDEIEMLKECFEQDYKQYQHESRYLLNNQDLLAWGRCFTELWDKAEGLQHLATEDTDWDKLADIQSGIDIQIMSINNELQRRG
jgi:hypothetical protein